MRHFSPTFYRVVATGSSLLFPILVGAQVSAPDITPIRDRISVVQRTLQYLIGLLFVVATFVFLWGVVKFIMSAGDEKKRGEAKKIMTWGIVGLAVMAGVVGIVNIITRYFGVGEFRPDLSPGGGGAPGSSY